MTTTCANCDTTTTAVLCRDCERRARADLAALADLHDALLDTASTRAGRHALGDDPPMPLAFGDDPTRPGPGDVRDHITRHVIDWTRTLATAGTPAPPITTDATDRIVHQLAAHLAEHAPDLAAAVENPTQLLDDLAWLHRVAGRLCGSPGHRVRIGTCDCGRTIRAATDGLVTCACGTTADVDTWRDHHGDPNATATTIDLSAWLSRRYGHAVTETTIRKAASNGRIQRKGSDGKGRTLYSISEAVTYWDGIHTPLAQPTTTS